MKKGLKKIIILFVILIIIAGLGGVAYYRYQDKIALAAGGLKFGRAKEERVDTSAPVAVYNAAIGSISESLVLNGDVIPVTEVNIFATVPGKIKEIPVQEGDSVKKDTVLAYIDRSEAGVTFALTPVESTIEGVVKSVMVENGAYITPQVPLFQIINMDDVEIVVHIPEKDIYKVRKGLSALITVVSYPDRIFKGKISKLSPVVDPVSRTREARIRIANKSHIMKPGMFGEVKIVIRKKNSVLIIPLAAVIERDGETLVFIVENGKAVRIEPEFDIREGNKISVSSGLKPGSSVIVIGQHNVDDGDEVNVTEEFDENL